MEQLWERAPQTGREVTDALAESVGWSRSTTLTLLKRLEDKGAVGTTDEHGKKAYTRAYFLDELGR